MAAIRAEGAPTRGRREVQEDGPGAWAPYRRHRLAPPRPGAPWRPVGGPTLMGWIAGPAKAGPITRGTGSAAPAA